MYKQVETAKAVTLEGGSKATPVATMKDEHGGEVHIINDDHCYVLCVKVGDVIRTAKHWFKEAVDVMKNLPLPV